MKDDQDPTLFSNGSEHYAGLSRRQFLRLGGGLVVLFSYGDLIAQEGRRGFGGTQGTPPDFNAFLRIEENGRVTCFAGKVELGQGVVTSLAQILAEELDVPFESVDMILGDTDLCPWDMGTFGSRSIKYLGPTLREAAAEAKAILIDLAADHLKSPANQLRAWQGTITDSKYSSKYVSYADLVKGKTIARRLQRKPSLKPVSEFTISGKPAPRTDALAKVTGKATYAGDIRLPGLLYAKLLRPPAHGAKLKSVDTSAAAKIKGVQIIRNGDMIAVLHPSPDGALDAMAAVKAQFDLPEPRVDDTSIFNHLMKTAPPGNAVAQGGNLDEGKRRSSKTFEATYLNSYVAHVPMETHTATARVEGGKATVWASTQTPFSAREGVASATGLPSKDVRVITPFVGGGFGGKSQNRQVMEAAQLAKLAGKPVQVAWTREEEFFYDTFRPAAIVTIKSGVTPSNQIVYWDYDVYFAGERSSEQPYDVPHHRTAAHGGWQGGSGAHPFAVGAWRAPASNTNIFAIESQVDHMAAGTGLDPLEFRLKNLKDSRMRRVLETAAKKFGWKPSVSPSGRGHGMACANYLGTYVATFAEVDVNKETGKVQVKRVVCAQDMGLVVNPEGATMQMEGCVTMGLGYALTEEVHFKGGKILDLNFDTYEIPRFTWLPKIETVLVDALDIPPQGGGEPPIICMGAVIANAVFDATGARLYQLPMTPERIKEAMLKVSPKKPLGG
jgi:nicotinate dehydrogenase subunit B